MSQLAVIGFHDEYRADEVMLSLSKLDKTEMLNLDDSATVVRKQDGEIVVKHKDRVTPTGAMMGSFWGLLIGTILMNPAAVAVGMGVGAASGATQGKLLHLDINDAFKEELRKLMSPGTSAIFLLIKKANPEAILRQIQVGDGRIIQIELPRSDEQKLRETVERQLAVALQ